VRDCGAGWSRPCPDLCEPNLDLAHAARLVLSRRATAHPRARSSRSSRLCKSAASDASALRFGDQPAALEPLFPPGPTPATERGPGDAGVRQQAAACCSRARARPLLSVCCPITFWLGVALLRGRRAAAHPAAALSHWLMNQPDLEVRVAASRRTRARPIESSAPEHGRTKSRRCRYYTERATPRSRPTRRSPACVSPGLTAQRARPVARDRRQAAAMVNVGPSNPREYAE